MKKRVILGALGLAAGSVLLGQALRARKELQRYNDARAMSGEGPLEGKEVSTMLGEIGNNFSNNSGDVKSFFTSIPEDAARYARIKSM
ncbi:MAG TPA: hypothetical protein VIG51_00250 [Candidatus Baltobacteraceae bacterium]|jgi:hypothetical protein